MFLTKKHIPRRTFLRGMGVSVALPFMESMLPAQTLSRNTAANPVTRYCFMYAPHGMIMEDLTPASEGSNFEVTPILSPLEPFRDQLHVVSGLEARPAGDGSGGDHMRSAAAYLSCTAPERNAGQPRPWISSSPRRSGATRRWRRWNWGSKIPVTPASAMTATAART